MTQEKPDPGDPKRRMITTAGTQLSDWPPASPRFKGPKHRTITTAGTQLSDHPPASPRFKGLKHHTRQQERHQVP